MGLYENDTFGEDDSTYGLAEERKEEEELEGEARGDTDRRHRTTWVQFLALVDGIERLLRTEQQVIFKDCHDAFLVCKQVLLADMQVVASDESSTVLGEATCEVESNKCFSFLKANSFEILEIFLSQQPNFIPDEVLNYYRTVAIVSVKVSSRLFLVPGCILLFCSSLVHFIARFVGAQEEHCDHLAQIPSLAA